jgi:hypothetical protein
MGRRKKTILPPLPSPSYYHSSCYQLSIQPSTIPQAGLGVFALEDISKGSFVDEYKGVRCTGLKSGTYFFQINEEVGINAEGYPRCYMAMLNSNANTSFLTNCEFLVKNEKIEVWTTRPVKRGEELMIDYGDRYFL